MYKKILVLLAAALSSPYGLAEGYTVAGGPDLIESAGGRAATLTIETSVDGVPITGFMTLSLASCALGYGPLSVSLPEAGSNDTVLWSRHGSGEMSEIGRALCASADW
jgi:hypothetical protein